MIRVFVVDDSATARRSFELIFQSTRDFAVVGSAKCGEEALGAIRQLRPDLVLLDAMMAGMVPALLVGELLAARPLPIVVVSSGSRDTTEVFEALAAGALDFIQKPGVRDEAAIRAMLELFRVLARVKVQRRPARQRRGGSSTPEVVVVASSTGGPKALHELLAQLPQTFPVPIVVAQHMTLGFERGLAAWLAESSRLPVRIADVRAPLVAGQVVLGVPTFDLVFSSKRALDLIRCDALGFHPSADALFASASAVFGSRVLAVVLSGIGNDGAQGSQAIVAAGGAVFAQSRSTSVVFGMPREVSRLGLAAVVGSPETLARELARAVINGQR